MVDENQNQIQPVNTEPQEIGLQLPNLLGKLTPDQLHKLINYTNPIAIIDRLASYGWNPDTEAAALVEIATQDEDIKAKLQAIRFLRTLVKDALISSGQFIQAKRKVPYGPDGQTVEFQTNFMMPNKPSNQEGDSSNGTTEKTDNGGADKPVTGRTDNPEASDDNPVSSTQPDAPTKRDDKSEHGGGGDDGIQQHRPPVDEHSELFPGISTPGT